MIKMLSWRSSFVPFILFLLLQGCGGGGGGSNDAEGDSSTPTPTPTPTPDNVLDIPALPPSVGSTDGENTIEKNPTALFRLTESNISSNYPLLHTPFSTLGKSSELENVRSLDDGRIHIRHATVDSAEMFGGLLTDDNGNDYQAITVRPVIHGSYEFLEKTDSVLYQGRPLRGDFLPSAALQPMGNTRHFLLSILTDFDPENSKG
ncbi:MAG: hypothetical protein ACR2PX_13365 [Endozoicomonas sp.]|uniref:hypothetical protein n=1 Tax=Endozoicomonas sp. TaxID=1892382 RepID=UPI003D9BD638